MRRYADVGLLFMNFFEKYKIKLEIYKNSHNLRTCVPKSLEILINKGRSRVRRLKT